MTPAHTAGTAGRNYRVDEPCANWQPTRADVGERVKCRCGLELGEHQPVVPTPRTPNPA